MNKELKAGALLLMCLLVAGTLSACGDNTATTVPAITVRASSTKTATTSASSASLTASDERGTVVIYSSLPLTGFQQHEAETLANAMRMALDDFTGGTNKIGNYTIKYVSLDDATAAKGQWDADQEAANASKAVADPDAMVYLGTYNSGAAMVSIPIFNKAGLVMISPGNTYTGLTRTVEGVTLPGDPANYYQANPSLRNYFRVVAADDVQGPATAAFMSTLKIKKVFIIDNSQTYGKGLADLVAMACKDYGLDCSQRASIIGKEADYKSLANDIKAKGADAIFFGGTTQDQAGKLISDIRASGSKIPFLSGDAIYNNAFITDARTAAEGVYTISPGIDEAKLPQKGQDFLKRYRAKFGPEEAYTIYGYEAMSVALDAIKRAGVKDRARILQAVAATKDFEGVTGKWSFDKNGDTTLTNFPVHQVKDGKWNLVMQIRPK